MIMTKILEKMSLLGLSLLLISAFSISTALPPMLDYYSPTYNASQVELLVSVPSFSVVAMLLLNPFVDKWLNDRQLIMTGLILLSSAGIFPFFVQWYPLVLLSRLVFGMGIGFTIALVLMGSIREIIGNGSWFGMVLNDGSMIQPMLILILPPGGFFVFGMLIALFNRLAEGKGKEPATLSCCNCPQAASCMKASEGGCE